MSSMSAQQPTTRRSAKSGIQAVVNITCSVEIQTMLRLAQTSPSSKFIVLQCQYSA